MHMSNVRGKARLQAAADFELEVAAYCGASRVPIRPIPDDYVICECCAAIDRLRRQERGDD
jgi:hypothetical protein